MHAPLVLKIPGVRRYVQCEVIDEAYAIAEPRWDGAALMWYDDSEAVRRSYESEVYRRESFPDVDKFVRPVRQHLGPRASGAAQKLRLNRRTEHHGQDDEDPGHSTVDPLNFINWDSIVAT